ncbi:MAG: hypothetical protein IID38_07335, partial [Planctomycetes bacterium]|nr:hypothetical protein [Planctomycetota bacterium]
DGDGQIDEDFAAALGQACTSGVGPCQAGGITICSADGTGTVCDAVALTGSPEGPSGLTCMDGIDNDCDGVTDGEDSDCGSADLTATCALPYLRGRTGGDCQGWHRISFGSSGGQGKVQVTAELQAWDIEGNVLASLPVSGGQHAHLTSRLDPEDWKWVSRTSRSRGTWHEVFAPVPMLVVTVQDGVNMARAFCSNVPFLDVILPADTVVSASAGNDVPVLVALPLMDVTTLSVEVDGVDILAGLGLDPATAFPGGPYGGVVDVNGSMAQVSNLVVSAAGIDTRTSNTLSMTLSDLGCGGHVVRVHVQRRSDGFGTVLVAQPTTACHFESGTDTGTVMVFKIEVTTPASGNVTSGGPTHVVGEACHGLPIASANINGFDLDVLGQTVEFGNGETSADTYRLTFDVMVPETDLRAQVDSGGGTSGSFTKGSNRLIAQACDPDGNCTYDSFFFAVGPIVSAPSATTAVTAAGPNPGEVERAFVLSISQNGINNFFEHLKNRQKRCLGGRAEDALRRTPPNRKRIPIDGACDPPTAMFVNNATLRNDNFPLKISLNDSVTADPREGSIGIRINLPPIDIRAHFSGYCETGCVCAFGGCACAVCVTVDLDGAFNQQDMGLEFTVTRNRLLQSGVPRDQRDPLDFNFDIGNSPEGKFSRIRGEIDIGCLLGFFLDFIDFFFQVLTLGLWDPGLGSPIVREITADDIVDRFGSMDGDPMDVDLAKFKNDDLPSEFGMRQRESRVSDAAINSTGLSVAIGASFAPEPSEIDPAAANIQGTPLKNAPIPLPPFVDAAGNAVGDVTIAISDDVFNQVFYSMVQTGRLRTQFEVTRTLGNFIPEDCSTIANDRKRARCIGLRSEDTCDRFCARFNGCDDACEVEYPYGGGLEVGNNRRQCCRAARIRRNTNIQLGTTLVLTGRVHNPPKLLIDDDPATAPVEVRLQYDQISIHLIADRDGDGNLDGESLDSLPDCSLGDLDAEFGTQSTDQTACILWETCLTARINLSMGVEINPRGRPRLKFNFEGIERDVPFGVQCGGTEFADLDFFNGEAGRSETMDLLEDRLGRSTPDLDVDGVDLGRAVLFQLDRVVAIETQPPGEDDGFQDYIGITGNIVARPDLCGNGTCDTEEDEDDCNCPEDCP